MAKATEAVKDGNPAVDVKDDKVVENALVEVEHNVETVVEHALVYINGVAVEFHKGVAKVSADVAKVLRDANIAKDGK